MTLTEVEFMNTARHFYERGLSVSEMQQLTYEAQLHSKRAEGKPAQVAVKERYKK